MLPTLSDVLTDLSLREGGQQECDLRGAPVATKIELARLAAAAGVRTMEVSAFAPGAWFSDAADLAAALPDAEGVTWRALYFNVRGLEDLLRFPRFRPEGLFHTALTANYREKNYRQGDLAAVIEKLKTFLEAFAHHGLAFDSLVLSTAWGERGEPRSAKQAVAFCSPLLETAKSAGLPARSITVCDTVGEATPANVNAWFVRMRKDLPEVGLRAHLHPPADLARASISAALDAGVARFEAAWCGMGGSPMADQPGGNLDIRDLIGVWKEKGAETGFDDKGVAKLVAFLKRKIRRKIV